MLSKLRSQPCNEAGTFMKLFIILFLIFIVVSSLNSDSINGSFSIRSPYDDSKPLDYEISIGCRIDSLLLSEVEFERQNGKDYRNIELFTWDYWKCLQFTGKYINIGEDSLKNISVDTRYKYKSHSAGIAEVWDLHPDTFLVFGEDIRWTSNLNSGSSVVDFLANSIQSVEFMCITNLYTRNFIKFNSETETMFSAKLSAIFSVYFRLKQRYYDEYKFSVKLGISIKI